MFYCLKTFTGEKALGKLSSFEILCYKDAASKEAAGKGKQLIP